MRRALLACPLLLLACGEKDPSTGGGADSGDEIVIDPPEEDDDEDPGPVDADGDGHDDTVDCDDGDAEVHPDATEAWNGVDDDCDGRRDADGSYRGTLSARATAVYEGDDYAFDLACTAALDRDGPDFTLVATCPTDAEDEMAQLLLGASLVLQVEEDLDEREAAWTEWEGRGVVRSSDGWDTWLDADLAWDGFDTVSLSASRSAASLAITAQGSLSWEPPEG